MAGSALQVHAEEDLRHVAGRLERGLLVRGARPAPDNAVDETLGFPVGRDQVRHEGVIRAVLVKGRIEPSRDLLPAAVDIPGPLKVVSKGIVPEGHPMLGVASAVREQGIHEPSVLVAVAARCKSVDSVRLWE